MSDRYIHDPNDTHTVRALEDLVLMYENEETIWPGIAPEIPVAHRSDQYWFIDEEEAYEQTNDHQGPNALGPELRQGGRLETYEVKGKSLAMPIPVEAIMNAAQDPIMPEMGGMMKISNTRDNNREKRVSDLIFPTTASAANSLYGSSYNKQLTGNARWDNTASNPVKEILDAMLVPLQKPNTMVIGVEAFTALRQHQAIAAAVYAASGGNAAQGGTPVPAQAIADLFGLSRLLVGERRINTANPGATPVYERIWGDHCLLAYVNPNPSPYEVNFCGTFTQLRARVVRKFYEEYGEAGSIYLKLSWNEDIKVMAPKAAYYFRDVIS